MPSRAPAAPGRGRHRGPTGSSPPSAVRLLSKETGERNIGSNQIIISIILTILLIIMRIIIIIVIII